MDRTPPQPDPRDANEEATDARDDRSRVALRRAATRHSVQAEPVAGLARVVEDTIVPALVRGQLQARSAGATVPTPGVTPVDAAEFARISLAGPVGLLQDYVEALRTQGVSLEQIYIDLFPGAARRLGEWWVSDLCDFADVTVAVGRLQQILRDLSPEFRAELECGQNGRRLLLVPAPGEQHTFGLFIVTDFFARAGWDVWGGPSAPGAATVRLVREEWFDVVGLSVGCEGRIETLATDIRAIRAASRNADVRVMVGGPMFVARPEYALLVGADGTATDGRNAVREAEVLVARIAERR